MSYCQRLKLEVVCCTVQHRKDKRPKIRDIENLSSPGSKRLSLRCFSRHLQAGQSGRSRHGFHIMVSYSTRGSTTSILLARIFSFVEPYGNSIPDELHFRSRTTPGPQSTCSGFLKNLSNLLYQVRWPVTRTSMISNIKYLIRLVVEMSYLTQKHRKSRMFSKFDIWTCFVSALSILLLLIGLLTCDIRFAGSFKILIRGKSMKSPRIKIKVHAQKDGFLHKPLESITLYIDVSDD
jgi:hypothetical protein